MCMNINWSNPYAERRGEWLIGNLHTHCIPSSPCGVLSLSDMVDLYAECGHDFLTISDHMSLTDPPRNDRMVFIPGIEWNSLRGEHTGVYSTDTRLLQDALAISDHNQLLDTLAKTDALVVLNHPGWHFVSQERKEQYQKDSASNDGGAPTERPQPVRHYSIEELLQKPHYDGLEIYNGVIERLPGVALAVDVWDALLAAGRRVLGFALDDAHDTCDVGNAWLGVRAPDRTAEAILGAIRQGNFYASTGVVLDDIRRESHTLTIESQNAEEIQVIGPGGRRLLQTDQPSLRYTLHDDDAGPFRFAAHGYGSSMAWTQPFFIDPTRPDAS